MPRPSVLFVTTVPVTLEAFLVPFAAHFRSAGWRVDALARGASSYQAIAGEFDEVHDAPWSRSPLDPANLFGAVPVVRDVVERGGYDIVHVHTPVAAFVTRFALRRRQPGRPLVVYTAHGFHFYEGQALLPHALFRALEALAAPWTDYLVAINREDERAARSFKGLPPGHVRFIPGIGVDMERFGESAAKEQAAAAMRAELEVPPEAFMVAMVAEFSAAKRHTHLLRALSLCTTPGIVAVFVGDGPLERRVRNAAESAGLQDRVRFAGYRRDIPAVLAASDALVLVSEREGLNRSVLEAMAARRPVIGTDTRGIADAVGDGGWIVPKDDVRALAAALDEAAANPEERSHRASIAYDRVIARFALPRIISEYEDLYREAIASRV